MKLQPKHFRAIEMLMEYSTYEEIASELNCSTETLYNWNKEAVFQQELRKRIDERFLLLACEAVQVIQELLNGAQSEQVRLKSAQDILDRSGFKPTDKQELEIKDINISINYGEDD